MSKIERTVIDETTDKILSLCKGSSGAYKCLLNLLNSNRRIDPGNTFGPLGSIIILHSSKIEGDRIHLLFHVICKENVARLIAVLRAVQLGMLCKTKVITATENWKTAYSEPINVKEVYRQVKQYLGMDFDPENEARFN